MVIEIRSFSFLVKKIVINSRFGRFHGFQKTFPHKKRKMVNAYFKFVQQSDYTIFSVVLNFVSYFCQFLMI